MNKLSLVVAMTSLTEHGCGDSVEALEQAATSDVDEIRLRARLVLEHIEDDYTQRLLEMTADELWVEWDRLNSELAAEALRE